MKTNISGFYGSYARMFNAIKDWNSADAAKSPRYLYSMGYAFCDAPYFGWTGETLEEEWKTYEKVYIAYCYLLKTLAEAIGHELPDHLEYINTDRLFEIKGNKE